MKLLLAVCFFLISYSSATFRNKLVDNVRPLSVQGRIVGGIEAHPGTFPYMVPLWAERISSQGIEYGTFCGASLISDEFVLTAAHCVTGDPVRLKLYFGSTDTGRDSEPSRIEVKVARENIIIHEGYDSRLEHDIALIKLTQKVNFTRDIQPVRLAKRTQTNLDHEVSIITGWGATGPEAHSDVLRYAQLRILPDEVCRNFYRMYYHPSNICIDGTKQSACHGDSGGAAVIVDREDRLFTQVGIASYASRRGCDKGDPVAYTRVTSYLDWIHKHTGIPVRD